MVADTASKEQVLAILNTFKHGQRTNVKKGILNNRDAGAFLFWHFGPMTVKEVTGMLRAWRGKVPHYLGGTSNLLFTYLFNDSYHGNYGCVGSSAMCAGIWMYHGGSKVRNPKDFGGRGMNFRRTFWYRTGKGLYAPTVECAKRIRELGLE
jgi:hypothetical protein